MKYKRIVIDMDNTICSEGYVFEASLAEIKPGARERINEWHRKGYQIIIYTARGWGEFKITQEWLTRHGIKYDILLCGKPFYDVWIDDKAIKFTSWDGLNIDE